VGVIGFGGQKYVEPRSIFPTVRVNVSIRPKLQGLGGVQARPGLCSDEQRDSPPCKRFQRRPTFGGGLHLVPGEYEIRQGLPEPSNDDTGRAKKIETRSYGKVEFCLPTKLHVLRATSSTFAPPHLIDTLNAFGLFARAPGDGR